MTEKIEREAEADKEATVRMYKTANRLRKKLSAQVHERHEGEIDPQAVIEADKIIGELCEDCAGTLEANLVELSGHWREMKDMDQSRERSDLSETVFILAHEIKDIALMCGYNLAASFAESLRDYIGRTELSLKAQRVIVQAHIDAMQVVLKQRIKDEATPEAEELKAMVKIAIEKYS